jgi:hypothetical protein
MRTHKLLERGLVVNNAVIVVYLATCHPTLTNSATSSTVAYSGQLRYRSLGSSTAGGRMGNHRHNAPSTPMPDRNRPIIT